MTKTLLPFVFLMSCSTVHFKSSNESKVHFDYDLNQDKEIVIEVEKKFYLWGAFPNQHELFLDKIFKQKGFDYVSDLRIEEIETARKAAWMIGTFGMYYPMKFKLIGRISE